MRHTCIHGLSLKAIVAVADGNRAIGKNGRLPWNFPEEYAHYLQKTSGHWIVMGRGSWSEDPRPGDRKIFVLSSTMKPQDGVTVIKDINEIPVPDDGKIMWVCGGVDVYKRLLPFCSELYLTHIHGEWEGDRFFPEYEHLFHVKETLVDKPEYTIQLYQRNSD